MKHVYSFEKLEVWQDARKLVKEIYTMTNSFPNNEVYALTSQIRRAAISIVSNIAEGTSRSSLKEQLRFVEIAYGSLTEVYCQLIIANDLGYLKEDKHNEISEMLLMISNKLNGLKNSINKRIATNTNQ